MGTESHCRRQYQMTHKKDGTQILRPIIRIPSCCFSKPSIESTCEKRKAPCGECVLIATAMRSSTARDFQDFGTRKNEAGGFKDTHHLADYVWITRL